MNQQKRGEIFARLAAANPQPTTELEYRTPYELLVAVILSAQATDKSVNLATRELFKAVDSPQRMVALGIDGLIPYIKTIGLFRTKAKNVVETSRLLLERHGGEELLVVLGHLLPSFQARQRYVAAPRDEKTDAGERLGVAALVDRSERLLDDGQLAGIGDRRRRLGLLPVGDIEREQVAVDVEEQRFGERVTHSALVLERGAREVGEARLGAA